MFLFVLSVILCLVFTTVNVLTAGKDEKAAIWAVSMYLLMFSMIFVVYAAVRVF